MVCAVTVFDLELMDMDVYLMIHRCTWQKLWTATAIYYLHSHTITVVKDHFCNMQIVRLLGIHFDGGVRGARAFVGAPRPHAHASI